MVFRHTCCICKRKWWALRPHRTLFGSPMCPACGLEFARKYGYLNRRHVDRWAHWERIAYGDDAAHIAEAYRVLEEDEALRETEMPA